MDAHENFEETVGLLLHKNVEDALNVSWQSRTTNADLFQGLPKVTSKIQKRRIRLAEHCIRYDDEAANKLVQWQLTEGRTTRGRRKIPYVDVLLEDTEMQSVQELKTIIEDREDWSKRVKAIVFSSVS